jgi:hypothetical protein
MRGKAASSTNAALSASDPRAALQHASKQPSIMSTSSATAHCRSPPVGGGGCDGIYPCQVRTKQLLFIKLLHDYALA